MYEAWQDPIFKHTVIVSILFITVLGASLFPFRKKNPSFVKAWASIQSWFIAAPILFFILGNGNNWPVWGFTALSIWCCKEYFQMTGMFHRSDFVWATYLVIIFLAVSIHNHWFEVFNIAPMILLGILSLIPLAQNNPKHMIQYMALSLIGFLLVGWGFMHIARIAEWAYGPRYVIYIIIMTEFCDNAALAVSKFFGKKRILDKITPRRTLEGAIISVALTLLVGYIFQDLLPTASPNMWLAISLMAALVGSLGDMVLSVIRRDIGVKDTEVFIWGRGMVLERTDRLIFVAPIAYYTIPYLQQINF